MRPSACWPVGSAITRHAITVFLCTSNPAQWVKITSMSHLRKLGGLAGYPTERFYLACSASTGKLATILGAWRYPGSNSAAGSWHHHRNDLTASPDGRMLPHMGRAG